MFTFVIGLLNSTILILSPSLSPPMTQSCPVLAFLKQHFLQDLDFPSSEICCFERVICFQYILYTNAFNCTPFVLRGLISISIVFFFLFLNQHFPQDLDFPSSEICCFEKIVCHMLHVLCHVSLEFFTLSLLCSFLLNSCFMNLDQNCQDGHLRRGYKKNVFLSTFGG